MKHTAKQDQVVQFSRGVPPAEAIPTSGLVSSVRAILEEHADRLFQYAPLGGYLGDAQLRAQIGEFFGFDPDGIFVSNGSLQVLDILSAYLLAKAESKTVLVETPTYDRAIHMFERHGGRVIGVPLEHDGLDLQALEDHLRKVSPAFLYLIPDFQNPSGVTLCAEKRRLLAALVSRHDLTVIEDIPYRELRLRGEAPALLSQSSDGGQVITVGSLTKLLSPGLRIGFAITDQATAINLARLAENTYLSPSPLCQAVAAHCMSSGLMRANISHILNILLPRHDHAVQAVKDTFGSGLIAVPNGGYYLGVKLEAGCEERWFIRAAQQQGVILTRGSAFYPQSAPLKQGSIFLRLPFHAIEPDDFAAGINRLERVMNGSDEAESSGSRTVTGEQPAAIA